MSLGEPPRDYLDVATHPDSAGVYNVRSGRPISVRRLAEEWCRTNAPDIELRLSEVPMPTHESPAFWRDRSRLDVLLAGGSAEATAQPRMVSETPEPPHERGRQRNLPADAAPDLSREGRMLLTNFVEHATSEVALESFVEGAQTPDRRRLIGRIALEGEQLRHRPAWGSRAASVLQPARLRSVPSAA